MAEKENAGADFGIMEYQVKNVYGDNYSGFSKHVRKAARAVIISDDKILLSHEVNIGHWMIPGGGLEGNETPEEGCVREVAEETGLVVVPKDCFLVINEFYEDWKFVSYYFVWIDTVRDKGWRSQLAKLWEIFASLK